MTKHTIPPLPEIPNARIKHVPDFPGYAVTDDGRVFSCRVQGSKARFANSWKEMTFKVAGKATHKYPVAHLFKGGKRTIRYVHRMALELFVGPCPPDMEACHNDGNTLNSNLDNLRWDTRSSNNLDKLRHGTMVQGVAQQNSKLLPADIRAIRKLVDQDITQEAIAAQFGVSQSVISTIIHDKAWTHV